MGDTDDGLSQEVLRQALGHLLFMKCEIAGLQADIKHDDRMRAIEGHCDSAKSMLSDVLHKAGYYEMRDGESEADWLRRFGPPLPPTDGD